MIRLHLGFDDIARTRFAAPGPYREIAVGAQVVQQPASSFRRLCAARGIRLPAAAGHLLALVPAHGNVPDFLAPEGATSLDEALETIVTTPDRLIRRDIAARPGSPASSWLRDLADGRLPARKALASSLREFHAQVLEPLWPAIAHVLDADLRSRAHQVAATGIAAAVGGLHPHVRWRDRAIEVDGPVDGEIDLAGRGLRLEPSFWTRPGFTLRWAQPTLAYPVNPLAWAAPAAATGDRDPLAAVVGPTRARVLRVLADEHTTSGLARALGISPSSASSHATALREAGLVTSRRRGQSVHHGLTRLGTRWTTDDRHGEATATACQEVSAQAEMLAVDRPSA